MVRRSIKLHIQAWIAAMQFLTRMPIPVEVPFEQPVLKRSVIYFPLAGLFIGLCVGAAGWLLQLVLPPWPAAVLLLALWTALSGGLHLDGWMDTADGVLSHRPRERMLEIMKDSRVGAMGVMAAVLLLMLKASLLAELLQGGLAGSGMSAATVDAAAASKEAMGKVHEISLVSIVIAAACWSRAWMASAIAGWPFARKNEGMGVLFNGVKGKHAGLSTIVAAAILFTVLIINGVSWFEGTMLVVVTGVVTLFCGGFMAVWLNKKLGGLTGDTYGAMNEAIETALLLAAVVWLHLAK